MNPDRYRLGYLGVLAEIGFTGNYDERSPGQPVAPEYGDIQFGASFRNLKLFLTPSRTYAREAKKTVFRTFSPIKRDYLLSLEEGAGVKNGYLRQGQAFKIWAQGGRDRVALFQCERDRGNFVSTEQSCDGRRNLGILGWLDTEIPGGHPAMSPLFQCSNAPMLPKAWLLLTGESAATSVR